MVRLRPRAFTLLEGIAVLAILAIIVAVLSVTVVESVLDSAHRKRAGSTLDRVQAAEALIARDWGAYTSWPSDLAAAGEDLVIRNNQVSAGPTEVSVVVGSSGRLGMAVAVDSTTCVFRLVETLEAGGGSVDPQLTDSALCTAASALPLGETPLAQGESMKTTVLNN